MTTQIHQNTTQIFWKVLRNTNLLQLHRKTTNFLRKIQPFHQKTLNFVEKKLVFGIKKRMPWRVSKNKSITWLTVGFKPTTSSRPTTVTPHTHVLYKRHQLFCRHDVWTSWAKSGKWKKSGCCIDYFPFEIFFRQKITKWNETFADRKIHCVQKPCFQFACRERCGWKKGTLTQQVTERKSLTSNKWFLQGWTGLNHDYFRMRDLTSKLLKIKLTG